jgi:hypothetical protein
MSKYDYLKKYMNPERTNSYLNSFHLVDKESILLAENTLNLQFPTTLKEFWEEIGCGFFRSTVPQLGLKDNTYSNRLVHPYDIVSILTEGVDSELITEQGMEFLKEGDIPFFEISDFTSYLVMKPNSEHPNAIYDIDGSIIEDSLETFIWKLYHVSPTYYLGNP